MKIEVVKGKPIKLEDGTVILPEPNQFGERIVNDLSLRVEKEISNAMNDPMHNRYTNNMRRTMQDLPCDAKTATITIAVLSFKVWGLDDLAISRVLNISLDDIIYITGSNHYKKFYEQLVESIRYAETETVNGYLSQNAHLAAQVVVSSLSAKNNDVRMSAAKDILDRSGFRPVDRVEHMHKSEDGLQINFVTKRDVPTITVKK